jgi:hypothetical protein
MLYFSPRKVSTQANLRIPRGLEVVLRAPNATQKETLRSPPQLRVFGAVFHPTVLGMEGKIIKLYV